MYDSYGKLQINVGWTIIFLVDNIQNNILRITDYYVNPNTIETYHMINLTSFWLLYLYNNSQHLVKIIWF